MRITITYFTTFIIATCISISANACICGEVLSTKQRIEKSDYIALVKVVDIVSANSRDYYKIKVSELILYKGNTRAEILVDGGHWLVDSTYETSCDINIEKGEVKLVFAYKVGDQVKINFCSGSMTYMDKDGFRDLFYGYSIERLNAVNAYFSKPLVTLQKENGALNVFYANGRKEATIRFKKGLRSGPNKYYYPNGSIRAEDAYVDGKLHGVRKSYNKDGTISSIRHYENGIEVDSSLTYGYNYETRKYYLWMRSFYDKKGKMIASKSYQVPLLLQQLKSDTAYLHREWYTDTVKNEKYTFIYHPNGRLAERYIMNSLTNEYIGDIVRYDDAGFVKTILRVVKGKPNELIYDATNAKPRINNQE